jgi:hypothetical protein
MATMVLMTNEQFINGIEGSQTFLCIANLIFNSGFMIHEILLIISLGKDYRLNFYNQVLKIVRILLFHWTIINLLVGKDPGLFVVAATSMIGWLPALQRLETFAQTRPIT